MKKITMNLRNCVWTTLVFLPMVTSSCLPEPKKDRESDAGTADAASPSDPDGSAALGAHPGSPNVIREFWLRDAETLCAPGDSRSCQCSSTAPGTALCGDDLAWAECNCDE